MFVVIGHAIGFKRAIPYVAPVCSTADAAISAWEALAKANGEPAAEEGAALLRSHPIDTLIEIYHGDEILVLTEVDVQ